jgi:hypothetical protein
VDWAGWVGCMGGVVWVGWVELVKWGVNNTLLPKLPTCFPFVSVAPLPSTPAQILQSSGLVSLQHHSRSAISSQLWTAGHNTSIKIINSLQVPGASVTLTENCALFERQ